MSIHELSPAVLQNIMNPGKEQHIYQDTLNFKLYQLILGPSFVMVRNISHDNPPQIKMKFKRIEEFRKHLIEYTASHNIALRL